MKQSKKRWWNSVWIDKRFSACNVCNRKKGQESIRIFIWYYLNMSEDKGDLMSRRDFLKKMAILAASAFTISLLPESPARSPKYDGPIKDFQGLEIIPLLTLDRLTTTLEDTRDPVLGKVARGVSLLFTYRNKPKDFPEWVDEKSFPFAFVSDNTSVDSTTHFSVTKRTDKQFIVPGHADEPQSEAEKLLMGIKLGLRYTPLSDGLLRPALLLAKEYLTLLHTVAMNEEFYDITLRTFPETKFLDTSGREIIDRNEQKAIGRTLLENNAVNPASPAWKVLDGFAMIMLGPVFKNLVRANKVNSRNLMFLVKAANVVTTSSPEFQLDLANFMQSWSNQESFLFPQGTGNKTTLEPYVGRIMELENQLYLDELPK